MSVKTKALSEKLARLAHSEPVCVQENAFMQDALALMREKQTPCLMVCRGQKLVGIFTERDYLLRAVGRLRKGETVAAYMTPDPLKARLDQTVGEAVEAMNSKGLRNLPIVDDKGAPASLVTVNTLIEYLADHFPAAVVNRPPQPHVVSEDADGA
ncbi:MAG: CBS domain-containing protein [Elusimicrobia bacterium]|nr:CBS domain-containing protein [Elusimicrobiota bacterium]